MARAEHESVPEALGISTSFEGDLAVVAMRGEVDVVTASRVQAALEGAGTGAQGVVADLTRIDFIDSAGLRALVAAHKALAATPMAVACGPLHRRLFEITGLQESFPVCDTVEAALAAVAPSR